MCGAKYICVGAVGLDEVWVIFFSVSVIFLHWYQNVFLIGVRPLNGVLEMSGSLFLSYLLHG